MRSDTPHFKPFDKELYDIHDQATKEKVARWIKWWDGCEVREGSQYGVDLECYRGSELYALVEVESREFGGRCTYSTIHVPFRKSKFYTSSVHSFLFAVDFEGRFGYYCTMLSVVLSPIKKVKNKYMEDNEYFYDVPIDKFYEIEINIPPYWVKDK